MKVAPVSADLLIKIGIAVGVLGLGYVLWRKVSGAAGDAFDAVSEAGAVVLESVNPASSNNIVNQAAAAIGGAIVSDPTGPGKNADGSWTVGGWLYDITHPGWQSGITGPAPVQGHSAYWKS